MVMLRRRKVMAAKIESTVGTAETLAAADGAFNIYNAGIQATPAFEQREGQNSFGYLSSQRGPKIGEATFRTMLEWDGSGTEPSWAETFFPACGWVNSSGTYTPRSEAPGSNVKTLTIGTYQDDGNSGIVFKSIKGAVGNFQITLPTGRPGFIDWTFTGVYVEDPGSVSAIAPTYPSDTQLRFSGGLAEWNGVNMCVEQAVINSGNEIQPIFCPTGDGYSHYIISNRRPTITANPEAVTRSTQDRWTAMLENLNEYALELDCGGPSGTSSDAVLSFDAPKAQIISMSEATRENLVTDEIEWQCNKNGATADQELSIVFTPLVDA